MSTEFKLSYTANEINEKLGKVDTLVSTVNGISPDANGNVALPSSGIIDVVELPQIDINENAFYRLISVSAKFASNNYGVDGWTCHCVNGLSSIGEPVSTDMVNITAYYNIQDGAVYGYADSMISAAGGIPVGWYPIGTLAQAFDITWGGVITNIEDVAEDAVYALVTSTYNFYVYQNGWTKLALTHNNTQDGGSQSIIDVIELPNTDINKNVFYRLMNGTIVVNREDCTEYGWLCYCVDGLPETGVAATNVDMSIMNVYYNTQDGLAYGYLDEMLAGAFGYPTGWYDFGMLMALADATYSGTITDIEDDPEDGSVRILLKYDFYIFQDGWIKVPFAYEKAPKFNITWDGDMTGRIALDISAMGYVNTYFVKVSDEVPTTDEVIGWNAKAEHYNDRPYEFTVHEGSFDTTTYPGAISINNYIVILYDSDTLATALGIPSGIYTNGIYFWLNTEEGYISRFVSPSRIAKIDSKYVDIENSLHSVAITGDYNELSNRPTTYADVIRYSVIQSLSSTYKSNARKNIDVYSKSEVDIKIANASGNVDLSGYVKTSDLRSYSTTTEVQSMINTAIGTAIGGSY